MAQAKVLLLVINLVFIRFALATSSSSEETVDEILKGPQNSTQTRASSSFGTQLFENLNSLDFAASNQHSNLLASTTDSKPLDGSSEKRQAKLLSGSRSGKTGKVGRAGKAGSGKSKQQHFGNLVASLLGQLEKVDVKRMITDWSENLASQAYLSEPVKSRQASFARSASNESLTGASHNSTTGSSGRSVALVSDAGNLLSIGKQLVKLARSQMSADLNPSASWMSPSNWLSSYSDGYPSSSHGGYASELMGHDFTAAGFKSDWFWLAVPAVIVVGAGVIIVPLIAAWLVSQAMGNGQSALSLSAAGKRRRRRQATSSTDHLKAPLLSRQQNPIHAAELLKLLNVHELMDDPHLLANKLSKLHSAIESVGSTLIGSTLQKYKSAETSRTH